MQAVVDENEEVVLASLHVILESLKTFKKASSRIHGKQILLRALKYFTEFNLQVQCML